MATIVAFGVTLPSFGAEPEIDVNEAVRILGNASESSMMATTAGHLQGTLKYYRPSDSEEQDSDSADNELAESGLIEVWFRDGRYHLFRECETHWLGYETSRTIFDGESLAISITSRKISVTGAMIDVLVPSRDIDGAVRPFRTLFPWDCSNLPREMVPRDFGKISTVPDGVTAAASLVEGILTLVVDSDTARLVVTAREADAFNVSEHALFYVQNGKVSERTTADWVLQSDGWYPRSLSYERLVKKDGYEKWNVVFDTIELGVDVDDEMFEFDALDVPAGTRIIDRSEADTVSGSPKVYYTPATDAEVEASVEGLLETVRQLPVQADRAHRGEFDVPSRRGWSFWRILILLNAVAALVIGALMVWSRKSHRE